MAINIQIMKKDQRPKIYALGDSLTLGVGSKGKNYPEKLSELLGQEVVNRGV